jgi:GWxTD domain-containing protein
MNKAVLKIMLAGLLAAVALSVSCKLYNLERKLAPEYADFISKVRFIITSDERRIFLELPDSEKPKFIEDFWERRNPDPTAKENAFKIEYFGRIERANKLFMGEGIPGWLTDRGRIYILFGPPTDRNTQPMGQDSYSRCSEVWYYGDFPVVFSDPSCTGSYKLVTYDLTALRDLNLTYMHDLSIALGEAQKTFGEEKRLADFDFNVRLKFTSQDAQKIEGTVVLDIPYGRIWFKAKGEKMSAALEVKLELRDSKKLLIWESQSSYDLALNESELREKGRDSYVIDIPFLITGDQALERLHQGKSMLSISLANKTGNEITKKILEFK